MRVDQKQESIVANGLTLESHYVDGIAAQHHSEATRERQAPVFFAHFVAAGVEPHHIFDLAAANASALKKFRAPKNRMFMPELNKLPGKLEERLLFLIRVLPIEP